MGTTFVFTIRRALAGVDRSSSGSYQSVLKVRVLLRLPQNEPSNTLKPNSTRHADLVRNTIHIRMLGVDAPEVILLPLPSSPSSQRHTPSPYSVRISENLPKRTPTRRSHGSKSTFSADDSNASLSSATNTGGSLRFRSSRTTVGGRAAARRVICLLRWYVRDGASCIRPRARSTAGGDNLRSSKRRPKRSMCLFYVLLSRARYLTVVRF